MADDPKILDWLIEIIFLWEDETAISHKLLKKWKGISNAGLVKEMDFFFKKKIWKQGKIDKGALTTGMLRVC